MGYEEQAKQHMRRVYSKADPNSPESVDELLEMQYIFMTRSTTMDASSTTLKELFVGGSTGGQHGLASFSTASTSRQV